MAIVGQNNPSGVDLSLARVNHPACAQFGQMLGKGAIMRIARFGRGGIVFVAGVEHFLGQGAVCGHLGRKGDGYSVQIASFDCLVRIIGQIDPDGF